MPTSPPVRPRRSAARETVHTCSERDAPANFQPFSPARKSLVGERERAAHPPSPLCVRAASVRDRWYVRSPSSSVHRYPARGHSEAATATCPRSARHRLVHCIDQLIRRETPHHGDDAIVAANGMKSKGKRDDPDSGGSQPAAPNVANDYPAPSDTIHLAQELERIDTGEVMENL